MEGFQNQSLRLTAEQLAKELQKMDNRKNFYENLQVLAASNGVYMNEFKKTLVEAVNKGSMEVDLRNAVFHGLRNHGNNNPLTNCEPLDYLRKAQLEWKKRVQISLENLCHETGIKLVRYRSNSDKDEMLQKWSEPSTNYKNMEKMKPLYAPKDFLEALFLLRNPNYQMILDNMTWDFSHIPLKVKTLSELKYHYRELATADFLWGLTTLTSVTSGSTSHGEQERIVLGEKVIENQQASACQEFLKLGAPLDLRSRLWSQILGSNTKSSEQYYSELKRRVLHCDMMVDRLIVKDVQLTASNNDQYFVFEVVMYQIMLCFTRDTEVLSAFTDLTSGPVLISLKSKPVNEEMDFSNGIIPFHGFTMYAAPVCFLFNDPISIYFTFRAFYQRYWFRLNEISSHPQSILGLCILFQRLLQSLDTKIWSHLMTHRIHPVRVVFKWLVKGFSGHLLPEQLLNLWDMIIAYDSLEVLSLLAVTILSFRKEYLLRVNTLQKVESVLADLSSLNVMALLQFALKEPYKTMTDDCGPVALQCVAEITDLLHRIADPVHLSNVHDWVVKLTAGGGGGGGHVETEYLRLLEFTLKNDGGTAVREPFASPPPDGPLPDLSRGQSGGAQRKTVSLAAGGCGTADEPASGCPELVDLLGRTDSETVSLAEFVADARRYTCDRGELMDRAVCELLADFRRASNAAFDDRADKLSDALAKEQATLLLRYRDHGQRMLSRAQILQDHVRELMPAFQYDEYAKDPDGHVKRALQAKKRNGGSSSVAAAAAATATAAAAAAQSNVDDVDDDADTDGEDQDRDEEQEAADKDRKKLLATLNWLRGEVERADCETAELTSRYDAVVDAIGVASKKKIAVECEARSRRHEAKTRLDELRQQSAGQVALIDSYMQQLSSGRDGGGGGAQC